MTTLRAIRSTDLDALSTEHESPAQAGEFNWFGFGATDGLRRRFESGTLLNNDNGVLAIADDNDEAIGTVSWLIASNGPSPIGHCWTIGIWILPDRRGEGHGSDAQRLAASYLFGVTRMARVQASTELDNMGEQRALEKAGFTREGVLRHALFRGGAWRDMVMFSKLRGE